MKRYLYRDSVYLGSHTLGEAQAMLEAGTLLPDDWVADGLGYIPLATWLHEAGVSGPHALPERRSTAPQFPSWQEEPTDAAAPLVVSRFPEAPTQSARKVIRLNQDALTSPRQPWVSRRSLLFGSVTCLVGVAVGKFVYEGKSSASESDDGEMPSSIRDLVRSIVRIVIKGPPSSVGTGFCIDCEPLKPNISVIATASHVVGGERLDSLLGGAQGAIIESNDGRTAPLQAPYCWDLRLDHCAFSSRLEIPPLKLARKLPAVGERIYTLGFAAGETFAITAGRVTNYEVESWRLVTSAKITPGFSGGPVVNEAGEVVGMSVTYKIKGPPSSSSVPLHELQNMCQRMDFINQAAKAAKT